MNNTLTRMARYLIPSRIFGRYERHRLKKQYDLSEIEEHRPASISNSTFGDKCFVSLPVTIWNCAIGRYSRIRSYTRIENADIGAFSIVAQGAFVGMGPHPTRDFVSTHPFFYAPKKHLGYPAERNFGPPHPRSILGSDVWIGAGAHVVAGVKIGHGAIIAAGSVVTKDVPPYAIYAGTPARLVRSRFDEDTINFLLEFCWWDKDIEWLQRNYQLFHSVQTLRSTMEKFK